MLKALGYAGFGSDKLDDWRTFGTSLLGFQAVSAAIPCSPSGWTTASSAS